MEPAFRSLLDSGIPKSLIRPKHYTKNGQHSKAIYILDDNGGAHMFAALQYGLAGDATVISQVDLSPWAQQSHADLANKFAHVAGFNTKPMDEA